MIESSPESSGHSSESNRILPENTLSVKELAQFLNDLGESLLRPTNGPLLGKALVQLSISLQKHHSKELDELLEFLNSARTSKKRQIRPKAELLKGINLQALDTDQVQELLLDERLSKLDLVDLGELRFGVSRSNLLRQNKQEVLESLHSALLNEQAYHIISCAAEKEGIRRARSEGLV